MPVLDHELGWLLDEEVFSVDGAMYSWGDVVVSAELRGALGELVSTTRAALGCTLRLRANGDELPPAAVREAAARFRYREGLLAAEELQAWLERWRLTVGEWTEHVSRELLRERRADEPEQIEAEIPIAAEELARAVAVDAICTGFLEREATRLATDAALAVLDPRATEDRRGLIGQIAASAATARAALAAATDIDREIESRALEWTCIDAELLELGDLEAAREAALCVRIDGRSLTEVAADCRIAPQRRVLYLEEAEREGLTVLLGAGAGELVGPIARAEDFLLVFVHGRTRPEADDPELRRRAEEYLVERASERVLRARVRWP
jgi:hypothetical protein